MGETLYLSYSLSLSCKPRSGAQQAWMGQLRLLTVDLCAGVGVCSHMMGTALSGVTESRSAASVLLCQGKERKSATNRNLLLFLFIIFSEASCAKGTPSFFLQKGGGLEGWARQLACFWHLLHLPGPEVGQYRESAPKRVPAEENVCP